MGETENNDLRNIVKVLPDKPGIYQFLDEPENIIYIG